MRDRCGIKGGTGLQPPLRPSSGEGLGSRRPSCSGRNAYDFLPVDSTTVLRQRRSTGSRPSIRRLGVPRWHLSTARRPPVRRDLALWMLASQMWSRHSGAEGPGREGRRTDWVSHVHRKSLGKALRARGSSRAKSFEIKLSPKSVGRLRDTLLTRRARAARSADRPRASGRLARSGSSEAPSVRR